jgi:membrane protein YqaA with SNARE-associated domain
LTAGVDLPAVVLSAMDPTALALSLAVVFAINLVPAFMPPTWAVLAALHFALGVPALPLAIGGALAASGGRLTLAAAVRRYGRRLLPPPRQTELAALGTWLEAKAKWAAPAAVLVYSFGPIPSNQLFVAAGLTGMSLGRIVGAFLAGRLVSYPLWIGAAHVAAARIDQLFEQRLTNVVAVGLDLLLIALLVAFTRLDWTKLIARFDPSFSNWRDQHAASADTSAPERVKGIVRRV